MFRRRARLDNPRSDRRQPVEQCRHECASLRAGGRAHVDRLDARHRLDRRILGGKRCAAPGPVLDRRRSRHGRQADLDRLRSVDRDGFHPVVHVCRDRGAVPAQVGRHFRVWGDRLGPIQQDRRPAVGLVQLLRLVSGSGDRFRPGGGLYIDRAVCPRFVDQYLADHAVRSGRRQERPDDPDQRDLHPGRRHSDRGQADPGRRHPALREHDQDHRRLGHDPAAADRCSAARHGRRRQGQFPAGGTDRARCARRCDRGRLEHGRLDRDRRRHVPGGLVDLRFRDRGVLHGRVQESEVRYVQGDLLFRIAVHRRLHAGAVRVPGLPRAG